MERSILQSGLEESDDDENFMTLGNFINTKKSVLNEVPKAQRSVSEKRDLSLCRVKDPSPSFLLKYLDEGSLPSSAKKALDRQRSQSVVKKPK